MTRREIVKQLESHKDHCAVEDPLCHALETGINNILGLDPSVGPMPLREAIRSLEKISNIGGYSDSNFNMALSDALAIMCGDRKE